MVNHFIAPKSAIFSPAVAMRARNDSGASTPKDDASNEPPLDASGNGNGNGNGNGELSTGKSKKKKKNKKRNSRASLTAEDAPADEDLGGNGSGAPSPVVPADEVDAFTAGPLETAPVPAPRRPPPPPPPPVSAGSPFDTNSKSEDLFSSLLDMPSPVAVSSGSPFDVFDEPANGNSPVVVSSSSPAANAASEAYDFDDVFGASSPVAAVKPVAEPVTVPPDSVGATHVEDVQTPEPVPNAAPEPFVTPEPEVAKIESALQRMEVATPIEVASHSEPEPAVVAEVEVTIRASPPEPPVCSQVTQQAEASTNASAAQSLSFPDPVEVVSSVNGHPEPESAATSVDQVAARAPTPEPPVYSQATQQAEAPTTAPAAQSGTFPDPVEAASNFDEPIELVGPPLPASEPVVLPEASGVSIGPLVAEPIVAPRIPKVPQAIETPMSSPADTTVHLVTKTEASSAAVVASGPVSDLFFGENMEDAAPPDLTLDTANEAEQATDISLTISTNLFQPASASSLWFEAVADKIPPPSVSVTPPPAPEVAKTKISKTPTATRLTKTPTNVVPAVKSQAVPASRPSGLASRVSSAGASTSTASAAPKAVATKTPALQRSLSGTPAVKITTKTPPKTAGQSPTAKPARRTSNSPTSAASSASAAPANEPRLIKKKLSALEIDAAGNRLYEQAMESKRRLEEKKALREGEYSFTPQVNAKSKKLDNAGAPDRFMMLHERAKETQRRKEELRQKIEKEECSFKPQITNRAKKISSSSDKPRFENLYKNAQEIQAKREEKKKQDKNEEELTFKPKINTTKSPVKSRPLYDPELVKQRRLEIEQKRIEAENQSRPKPVKKTRPADGDNKIFDRLYQAGQQRNERIARLKQERDDQEKATTTFQPKVSSASGIPSGKPFHERLYDKEYLKRVAAEREQKKIEEEKKRFSFKPRVSEMPDSVKSKGSNESGSAGKSSIFERLYQDKDRVKEKIEMSEELKIQKEMEECTFRPQIEAPTSVGNKNDSTTPIWERLLNIDKNQIADERDRQKAELELEACTFRPDISVTPGSLSPKRGSSSNIFERLSTSAGNTPVDDKKRRPSERKSVVGAQGKRNSYNERGSAKPNQATELRALSVGGILKASKLSPTSEETAGYASAAPRRGGRNGIAAGNGAATADTSRNFSRSPELEMNEDSLNSQSKSILENYDNWAASLEQKMRNL